MLSEKGNITDRETLAPDNQAEGKKPSTAAVTEAEEAQAPSFKIRRAIYPVVIGLGVVAYLFWKDFNPEIFDDIDFRASSVFWLMLALVFMFGRDFGYILRLRTLTGGQLSWRQCFRVIMLWEFTSAVTPSAIGGTSFAILYIHKEGISIGKSSSIVMLTSWLDELYFIILFPILFLVFGKETLFDTSSGEGIFETGIMALALVAYLLKLAYLLILTYGLFFNPRGLKWLLMKLFRLSLLRRWYRDMNKVGTDIINSSAEIRTKGRRFWASACASTFLSWTSRYLVANAIVMAFFAVSDHFLL
ncbi:MAG: flippase-like domain-containing protein, partial [Alistipes sp.]|nr:flippase-like domain-containing protein [Alistipes sp.]